MVPGLGPHLLNLYLGNLVLDLVALNLIECFVVLLSVFHFLLEQLALRVDNGILSLKLLNALIVVHVFKNSNLKLIQGQSELNLKIGMTNKSQ